MPCQKTHNAILRIVNFVKNDFNDNITSLMIIPSHSLKSDPELMIGDIPVVRLDECIRSSCFL